MRSRLVILGIVFVVFLFVRLGTDGNRKEDGSAVSRTETVKSEPPAPEAVEPPSEPKSNPIAPPAVDAKTGPPRSTGPPPPSPLLGQAPAPAAVPAFQGGPVLPPGYYPPHRLPKPAFVRHETKASRVVKDREIEDFTKAVRAKNIAPFVLGGLPYYPAEPSKPAAPSSNEAVSQPVPWEKLMGTYEGEIKFDDGKQLWQMALELSGKVEEGKLKGEATVDLLENGVSFSKTTQKGELTLLKKAAEDSKGVLVFPTDKHAFQLYYLPERDMLAGNYYEKKSPLQMIPVATVRLSRKPPPKN